MVGEEGFEPSPDGTRNRCPTIRPLPNEWKTQCTRCVAKGKCWFCRWRVSLSGRGVFMADPIKLAYFMAVKEGASYLGGLLVTDTSGIPLDFRYTEPITPTRLQSILYGKSLEPHLKEEVIQKTLLKELKLS